MKTIKPLPPLEELERCFRIDPTAPSGLTRIGSPGRKQGKLGATGGIGSDGYWRVNFHGSSYRIHRIIWALENGRDPGELLVDHIDGNPLNNATNNLRACTDAENLQNKRSPGRASNSDLPKGIIRQGRYYVVRIMAHGVLEGAKLLNLRAATLYAQQLRAGLHGDFARDD
ncbi:HNH endonuclease [Pseudomonas sp. SR9]|uniref:HNH endonuclease n=1 Tax=Aquipseudomonas guryensis TaxID=2759165 RepID=A0A7W4H3T6_9GAMM|nr:HNH endonuclease [Pseudomonas guryensis]